MSRIFGDQHRALPDCFDSHRMADRIEQIGVKAECGPAGQAFIEARDMFFLSSLDHRGRPTASSVGCVRVPDPRTLAFPSYDGNGVHYSGGDIAGHTDVGLLFIDCESPHRIRVRGRATASADDPLPRAWREAERVVRVELSEQRQNCPRHFHRCRNVKPSRHVLRAESATPLCEWKRIDGMQHVSRLRELAAVEQAGNLSFDEWLERIETGDERA